MCDQNNNLEHLKFIFQNINEWLKFAEQKNAALIVLNSGIIWGYAGIYEFKGSLYSNFENIVSLIGLFLILLSTIICLATFHPVLNKLKTYKNSGNICSSDNCFYFGDIAKYSDDEYEKKLKKILHIKEKDTPQLHFSNISKHLIMQIVTNSKISFDKYKKFTFSLGFTFIAIILLSISMYIQKL